MKNSKASGLRKNVKLPGFKPRSTSVTPITFSVNYGEDIFGLDEAVHSSSDSPQTFGANPSMSFKSPTEDNPADFDKECDFFVPLDPTSEYELAVEATDYSSDQRVSDVDTSERSGDQDAVNETPSVEVGFLPQTETETPSPHPTNQSNVFDCSPDTPVNISSSSASGDFTTAVSTAPHVLPRKPAAPTRPPPFRPRPPKNTVVAAADIHALIDSFPAASTKSTQMNTITPNRSDPNLPSVTPISSLPSTTDAELNDKNKSAHQDDTVVDDDLATGSITGRIGRLGHSPTMIEDTPVDSSENQMEMPATKLTHAPHLKTRRRRSSVSASRKRWETRHVGGQQKSPVLYNFFLFALLGSILGCLCYLTAFSSGLAVGVIITLLFFCTRDYLYSYRHSTRRCHVSGLPLGQLCCSLHCYVNTDGNREPWWPVYSPAFPPLHRGVPQMRDLSAFNIPHMNDEDPNSSASGGPLGSGLGFKFDKNDRPVYRGWMNEVVTYDPETHHVNQTHSVFVTLDGTQLRLQRPRRNISRRSMWSEELPAPSGVRFQHQRIYDLIHSRVILLPNGLVSKRLWSKKYPISITLLTQTSKQVPRTSSKRSALLSSTSVPNMNASCSSSSLIDTVNLDGLSELRDQSRSSTPADLQDDGFSIVTHSSTNVVLFLFGRTCREKESWYRRLRAASLGVPLLWTPQLASRLFLSVSGTSAPNVESRSDDETRSERDGITDSCTEPIAANSENLPQLSIPGTREPIYVSYIRYMAKYMPADWLTRGAQVLRLNVNYVSCEPSLTWLNALLARMFWDFLREAYWLERIRDKLQAKLKKIHLPPFISDLIVVGIDLGTELPVIRRIGRPHLDAHGLWLELDIAYAGGFSVALETNVNLLRWNQKTRVEWEAANLADDVCTIQMSPEQNVFSNARRSNRLGAFVSDEEDSADSTTDSDTTSETRSVGSNSVRRLSGSGRPTGLSGSPSAVSKLPDEERPPNSESLFKSKMGQSGAHSPSSISRSFQLSSALPSRKRLIRMVDRITRSTYFQKAVDNKLVQRGMELISNTPIVLEAEVQALSGTLLLNIPPPQSDRLWYGFRPNPQLRIKARPRVGEKAVTMSRILEWIESRVGLEFQRLVVLPNMDDVSIPLLLSDVTAGGTR